MIKIICDRCNKEISDGNIGYIATNWRSAEDGSLLGDNPHEAKHFCSSCMKEFEEFVIKSSENVIKSSENVIKSSENVIKTAENVSETAESVSKEVESVPDAEEQAPEQEESKGKRRQIDVGKIMALKNAGWKNKDIADEMHMEPQAVANVIYQQKKKEQSAGAIMTRMTGEISNERPKL